MSSTRISLFDTALGVCGIAWNRTGIAGINLPEATRALTRERLNKRFDGATESVPSTKVQRIVWKISAILDGRPVNFDEVSLDMHGVPEFHRRAYEFIRTIHAGSTLSYGEVAARLGKPGAAHAVGQAMRSNPFPIIVPCHRVVAANGKLGGFSATGGTSTKLRLLQIEAGRKSRLEKDTTSPLQGKLDNKVSLSDDHEKVFNVNEGVKHLCAADATLAALIKQVGTCDITVNRTQNLFLALAEAIIYQQLHGKAAATIFKRVSGLFQHAGEGFTAGDIARCPDDKLRNAGLSKNKLLALRDLSDKVLDGSLPDIASLHELEDESIVEQLTAVRGVGRWTVEMLLIFRLGRPDILPVDDFGVRKGFMLAYQLPDMPSSKELRIYGERWAPYRSIASWYLWRATDKE